jgi:predicted phosphodiesterase
MRLFYLGDIHGNYNIVKMYIKKYDIKDANIIQVGDFGLGFKPFFKDKRELEMYHKILVDNNVTLWAIRGNHDYKPYFDNDPFGFSNIRLIKDYEILELSNKRILCIGGAISVDRMYRKTHHQLKGDYNTVIGNEQWWVDEIFDFKPDLLESMRNIDIVVTHTAPDYCTIDNRFGFGNFVQNIIDSDDPDLKYDLLEERNILTQTFDILSKNNNITNHYYGHFHKSSLTQNNGIDHRLLDISELWEEKI